MSNQITNNPNPMPHLGKMIRENLEYKNIRPVALARAIHKTPPTIAHYLKRNTLNCQLLWETSLALQHNFFRDIAAQLPSSLTTNATSGTENENQIAQLKEEIKMLTRERDLLKNILAQRG